MIKLSENIYWDPNNDIQTEESAKWVHENVMSKLGLDDSNPNLLAPEKDEFGRPVKWEYKGDNYTIEVIREYIYPRKWAMKNTKINVISNE